VRRVEALAARAGAAARALAGATANAPERNVRRLSWACGAVLFGDPKKAFSEAAKQFQKRLFHSVPRVPGHTGFLATHRTPGSAFRSLLTPPNPHPHTHPPAQFYTTNDAYYGGDIFNSGILNIFSDCVEGEFGSIDRELDMSHSGVTTGGANSYWNSDCTPCPPGRYGFHVNQITCIDCPVGKWQGTPGSTSCINCGQGKYGEDWGQDAESACEDCPVGRYFSNSGAGAPEDCIRKYPPTERPRARSATRVVSPALFLP